MKQGKGEEVAKDCHWNIFELEYRKNKTHKKSFWSLEFNFLNTTKFWNKPFYKNLDKNNLFWSRMCLSICHMEKITVFPVGSAQRSISWEGLLAEMSWPDTLKAAMRNFSQKNYCFTCLWRRFQFILSSLSPSFSQTSVLCSKLKRDLFSS